MDVFPNLRTNFRQYGQIKKQRRAVTEKGREEERRSEKKEDPGARKSRKVVKHCVFTMICGPEGREVGSLKRRVRSHPGR